MSRRVEKFADLMQSVWSSRNDYETRTREVSFSLLPHVVFLTHMWSSPQLLAAIEQRRTEWAQTTFKGTYADARDHSTELNIYKQTTKREWVTEKQDLASLFGNVQTKLKTYNLRPYLPPPGLDLEVCGDLSLSFSGSTLYLARIILIGHGCCVDQAFGIRG